MIDLPKHVTTFRDRHGKSRYRFRRGGLAAYINAAPGTDQFLEAYAGLLKCAPDAPRRSPGSPVDQMRRYFERREWPLQGPYVYFVAGHGVVKIGFSSMIAERMRQLTTSSHTRLRFLAAVPGNENVERAYHSRFADDRKKGEWFRLSGAVRAAIHEIKGGTIVYPLEERLDNVC